MQYGYYGSGAIYKTKPTHGVHEFMLDEYVKKCIDKREEKFSKKFEKIIDEIKKETDRNIHIDNSIKELKSSVDNLKVRLKSVVKKFSHKEEKDKKINYAVNLLMSNINDAIDSINFKIDSLICDKLEKNDKGLSDATKTNRKKKKIKGV